MLPGVISWDNAEAVNEVHGHGCPRGSGRDGDGERPELTVHLGMQVVQRIVLDMPGNYRGPRR